MGQIVDDLAQRSILLKNQETCTAPDTSAPVGSVKLTLNETHRLIRKVLQRSTSVEAESRPRGDPFAELLPALEEAQRNSGFGYYPSVQQVLEARLGSRLRDLGYSKLSVFLQEAERRGLVRLGQLDNGAQIIFRRASTKDR